MIEIVVVDPTTSEIWAKLAASPEASLFVSPPWMATIAATYGCAVEALVLMADGQPRSGIAYTRFDDAAGRRLASLAFSDFADPVLGRATDLALLLEHLTAACPDDPLRIRVLHTPIDSFPEQLQPAGTAAWHLVDVPADDAGLDEVWAGLGGSARRNIRKARDAGVDIRFSDDLHDAEVFFDLHLGVRKHKYRLLPQPRAFIQNMHAQFNPMGKYWTALAERDGESIAAVTVLLWNDTAYYKFNASSPAALEVRPNDLLMWECISFASRHGCTGLDLGVSDLDQPGLIRYKAKFADRSATVTTVTNGIAAAPAVVDLKRRLGSLTEALTDASVPDAVTAEAGALFYQYFS